MIPTFEIRALGNFDIVVTVPLQKSQPNATVPPEAVRHENDDPDVADSETTTAGIYCFDTSIFDSWSQLGSTTVRIFVQVVAAIATFLGLVMVIMLWKTTRKPHGKCYHRTMGFFSEYICPFKRSTTYKNHIN